MIPLSSNSDKIGSIVAGATGGAALFHYATALGLGLDREMVGHIAPLLSFAIGWVWVVFYQETFGRFNVYRLKTACQRRMAEIDTELASTALTAGRRQQLVKERSDCSEIISQATRHDLRSRLNFSLSH